MTKLRALLALALVVGMVALIAHRRHETHDDDTAPVIASAPVVRLAPAPRTAIAPSVEQPAARPVTAAIAPDTAGIAHGSRPKSLRTIPSTYRISRADGFAFVNLAGGDATTRAYGAREPGTTKTIAGHVMDRAGHPVANAIVMIDRQITVHAGTIMVPAAAMTDSSGAWSAERVPVTSSVAIALAQTGDWSSVGAVGSDPVELVLTGHGAVTGALTFDGHGDSFALHIRSADHHVIVQHESETTGLFTIASLPPGAYTLTAGLAVGFGTSDSASRDRAITVTANGTTNVELAFATGTTILATAQPPRDSKPPGFVYWLFTGRAPATAQEARARNAAEHPRSFSFGGSIGAEPAQFNDVAAGTYAVCAGIFDPKTMDAMDAPFGCTPVTVRDDEAVASLAIALR